MWDNLELEAIGMVMYLGIEEIASLLEIFFGRYKKFIIFNNIEPIF